MCRRLRAGRRVPRSPELERRRSNGIGLVYPRMTTSRLQVILMDQALTVKEVALLLQVDEKTVYRLTQKGELPGFKVAGSWRFKRADMDAWVERQKIAVKASLKSATDGKNKERH